MAVAMGRVVINLSDFADAFPCSPSYPGVEDEVCFDSPSAAPHATATRAAPRAAATRATSAARNLARARARMGAVGRASSDDEQPRGHPGRLPRWRRFGLERPEVDRRVALRVGELLPGAQVESGARSPVTRAATKAAADPGLDAHSADEKNSHGFNQEDERVGHVPCNCKYCLKPSPLLVGRKRKNHVQVDGNCKRIARPAAKNDDKEPAPPEEILEALREIPRLERADLLRAYSMLIRDDRLFRSLMALPKDMRKDWLLMEIGNQ